jgi:hypothetical protein
MFGPPYRFLFSIIISYAILFVIYPKIAALFVCPCLGAFFFYSAFNMVRNGDTAIAYGFHVFTFKRNQKPFMFWFFIMFYIFWGILALGMGILVFLKTFNVINSLPF